MMEIKHKPVLLEKTIDSWLIDPNGCYVDGTFGGGGHSKALLARLSLKGRLYAMDCDQEAVERGKILTKNDHRFTIKKGNFVEMGRWLENLNLKGHISGILLDLGVSSFQLETLERGFSFRGCSYLDMRMDQDLKLNASKWLNQASELDLQDVLFKNGEARYSRAIARAIVQQRELKPLEYTSELVELISRIVPAKLKHPATRTFQAIRIFINNELENLKKFLETSLDLLSIHGRILIITFHSLEEQIVKTFIKNMVTMPTWVNLPSTKINIRLKKVARIKPSVEEIKANIRARSATLTVMEKIK